MTNHISIKLNLNLRNKFQHSRLSLELLPWRLIRPHIILSYEQRANDALPLRSPRVWRATVGYLGHNRDQMHVMHLSPP